MSASAKRFALLCFFLAAVLSGCHTSPAPSYELSSEAYEHPLRLTVQGLPGKQAHDAAESAIADLHFIEEISHPWRPGPLGRTNQLLPLNAAFSANPSVLPLIRHAAQLSEASEGYFNPALGKLHELWGLIPPSGETHSPPGSNAIKALLAEPPQMGDIHIDGIQMHGTHPLLRLDFGFFAQGYAIDTALMRLHEAGATHGRVDNAPFSAVFGTADRDGPALQIPMSDKQPITVTLSGKEALVRLDSREYRFIHPRTGKPLESPASALVIAASAADAAAAAEALLYVQPGNEHRLLQAMHIEYALVLRPASQPFLTPQMKARLHFPQELMPPHMVNGQ